MDMLAAFLPWSLLLLKQACHQAPKNHTWLFSHAPSVVCRCGLGVEGTSWPGSDIIKSNDFLISVADVLLVFLFS